MQRTFDKPVPWGLGPGPAQLYSVGGALTAVNMWLELMPDRRETKRERELMLTVRDILADVPSDATPTDITSAKQAIEGMVQYSRSREAELARIEAQMAQMKRRPRATSRWSEERA